MLRKLAFVIAVMTAVMVDVADSQLRMSLIDPPLTSDSGDTLVVQLNNAIQRCDSMREDSTKVGFDLDGDALIVVATASFSWWPQMLLIDWDVAHNSIILFPPLLINRDTGHSFLRLDCRYISTDAAAEYCDEQFRTLADELELRTDGEENLEKLITLYMETLPGLGYTRAIVGNAEDVKSVIRLTQVMDDDFQRVFDQKRKGFANVPYFVMDPSELPEFDSKWSSALVEETLSEWQQRCDFSGLEPLKLVRVADTTFLEFYSLTCQFGVLERVTHHSIEVTEDLGYFRSSKEELLVAR